jgi:hypothetical protein
LAETIKFCPIFESWIPKKSQTNVILDTSLFIGRIRSKEQLIDLR